jgi:hypothetical protein
MLDIYMLTILELERAVFAARACVTNPWGRRTAREQAEDAAQRELEDILKLFGITVE